MAKIYTGKTFGRVDGIYEDPDTSKNRIFIDSYAYSFDTLAPIFGQQWYFQNRGSGYTDYQPGQAPRNWVPMTFAKGSLQGNAWSDSANSVYGMFGYYELWGVSLDYDLYPPVRLWRTEGLRQNNLVQIGSGTTSDQYGAWWFGPDMTEAAYGLTTQDVVHYHVHCWEQVENYNESLNWTWGTDGTGASLVLVTYRGMPDSSSYNHTVNRGHSSLATGAPRLSGFSPYAPAPYGSIDLTGQNGLQINDHTSFNFGSGDFTIEFWFYPTSFTGHICILGIGNHDNGGAVVTIYNSKIYCYIQNVGNIFNETHTKTLTLNTWIHFAWVKRNGRHFMYVDGQRDGRDTLGYYTGSHTTNGSGIRVGRIADNRTTFTDFRGYIAGLRIIKGFGYYIGPFDRPNMPPSIDGTIRRYNSLTNNVDVLTSSTGILGTYNPSLTSLLLVAENTSDILPTEHGLSGGTFINVSGANVTGINSPTGRWQITTNSYTINTLGFTYNIGPPPTGSITSQLSFTATEYRSWGLEPERSGTRPSFGTRATVTHGYNRPTGNNLTTPGQSMPFKSSLSWGKFNFFMGTDTNSVWYLGMEAEPTTAYYRYDIRRYLSVHKTEIEQQLAVNIGPANVDAETGQTPLTNTIPFLPSNIRKASSNRYVIYSSHMAFPPTFSTAPITTGTLDFMVVGGGGGSGSDMGGGGGGGGYRSSTGTSATLTAANNWTSTTILSGGGAPLEPKLPIYANNYIGYQVTVGAAGTGAPAGTGQVAGSNGGFSQFGGIISRGGSGGSSTHSGGAVSNSAYNNPVGGSGGGASGGRDSDASTPTGWKQGLGTPGQGYEGAESGRQWYPGGGGGAGSRGKSHKIWAGEDFSDANWVKSNVSITTNIADFLAPDGTQTADKYTINAAGAYMYWGAMQYWTWAPHNPPLPGYSGTNGPHEVPWTFSLWVRAITTSSVALQMYGHNSINQIHYDARVLVGPGQVVPGMLGATVAYFTELSTSTWSRICCTCAPRYPDSGETLALYISTYPNVQPSGEFAIWGAQVERGPPTPYLPGKRSSGGIGIENNILGPSYFWAGGGGGSGYSEPGGDGGLGGGGGGAVGSPTGGSGGAGLNPGAAGAAGPTNAQAQVRGGAGGTNTGGGGGGSSHYNTTNAGANGGSGIVVIKYPDAYTINGGTGLTFSTSISGAFKITQFTAGTGIINFNTTPNVQQRVYDPYQIIWDPTANGSTGSIAVRETRTIYPAPPWNYYNPPTASSHNEQGYNSYWIKPHQFVKAGVVYITMAPCDKWVLNSSQGGQTRFATYKQRQWVTFTTTPGNDDHILTFHSVYAFSTFSDFPLSWVPFNDAGDRIVTFAGNGVTVNFFNTSTYTASSWSWETVGGINYVTLNFATSHGLTAGTKITTFGALLTTNPPNGGYVVLDTPSSTSLRYIVDSNTTGTPDGVPGGAITMRIGWRAGLTVPIRARGYCVDRLKRLWVGVKLDAAGEMEIHLIKDNIPNNVTLVLSAPMPGTTNKYQYAGSPITTTLNVNAYDIEGNRMSALLTLTITGLAMTFSGGATSVTITTSAVADTAVAVTIVGAGTTGIKVTSQI